MQTPNFDVYKRLSNEPISIEDFKYANLSTKTQKTVKMQMEVKKIWHQYVRGYHGENFELRERLGEAGVSCQVMIYPRYMMVNKTSMYVISERQQFAPYTNDYLNTEKEKDVISIKIPGYSSQDIDVTTIGLSGVLKFDLEN